MQARRASLYAPAAGEPPVGPPADTILFYDDFSVSKIDGQNLTDRTPAGTNAVAGTSYLKMATSALDNETFGAANARPKEGGVNFSYSSTEMLPASGLEWGTSYHALDTNLRPRVGAAIAGVGLWCSSDQTTPGIPQTGDGIFLFVYDISSNSNAEVRLRVRNNEVDVVPTTNLRTVLTNNDIAVRVEAEIIGDTVHFAVIVNGTMLSNQTVLFDVAKANTRAILFNRVISTDAYASRTRLAIQVDTYRNFLP
jgi:hypothetical protein